MTKLTAPVLLGLLVLLTTTFATDNDRFLASESGSVLTIIPNTVLFQNDYFRFQLPGLGFDFKDLAIVIAEPKETFFKYVSVADDRDIFKIGISQILLNKGPNSDLVIQNLLVASIGEILISRRTGFLVELPIVNLIGTEAEGQCTTSSPTEEVLPQQTLFANSPLIITTAGIGLNPATGAIFLKEPSVDLGGVQGLIIADPSDIFEVSLSEIVLNCGPRADLVLGGNQLFTVGLVKINKKGANVVLSELTVTDILGL